VAVSVKDQGKIVRLLWFCTTYRSHIEAPRAQVT
jgi:hypothetical protein